MLKRKCQLKSLRLWLCMIVVRCRKLSPKKFCQTSKKQSRKDFIKPQSKLPIMEKSLCKGTGFYSHIKGVSLYNLSESLFKKYRITFLANFLLTVVSHSANRMISAVPASKSNEISPHSPSLSTW